jgi:hypothetical protein
MINPDQQEQIWNEAIALGKGLIRNSETDGRILLWDSDSFIPVKVLKPMEHRSNEVVKQKRK